MSEMTDYVDRIEAATITLEANVGNVESFVPQLSQAVSNAEQAALDAQNTADAFNNQNPLLKAEYGALSAYTSRVVITDAEALDAAYGSIYKMDSGATGVSVDALPDPSFGAVHFYVYNTSGASVSITSSVGTVENGSVPDETLALVVANEAQDGYYTIPLAGKEEGNSGGGFDWTSIPEATTSLKGLMSAEDKTKLNSLSAYTNATQSEDGLMSSTDKTKLDNVEEEAQKNVKADFNATSGDALILNKPEEVYQGPLVYDPVTETNAPDTSQGKAGFISPEDSVHLDELWEEYEAGNFEGGSGGGGVEEAPADSKQYVRKNASWEELKDARVEEEYDPVMETTTEEYFGGLMSATDKEALDTLVEGSGGGSGLSDAPVDGKLYLRKDGAWVEAPVASRGTPTLNPVTEQQEYNNPVSGFLSGEDYLKLYDLINP